jgi:LysR substrate binding domain
VSLTDEGRALHAGARALVEEYDQLERSAQQTTKPHGRLKVSAPISFGLQLGPTLLDFARAYPDIGLDVSFTDRLVNLVDEGFDVAVRISTFADSSLIARKLANVGAVTVASPDYLARRGTPRTPGDLQDHDIILDTNVPNRHVWQYVRGKKRLDVGVDGRRISLLSRFVQKLLEQPAQFELRAIAAVAHDRRRDVARAIDPPVANRRAPRSRIALRAGRAALSLLASDPALALAGNELPAGTRAGTRLIFERDEAAAVESNDVETTIFRGLVERAAHGEALAVAASSGEAEPVGMRRWLPGVAPRLIGAAVIGDDVALIVDRLGHPQLDERQLAGRSLLAPRPRRPRRPPHLWVALNLREELGQDTHHKLMLGGDALLDAPIDVIERGRRRVELALARLRLFALGFLAPPAIKRILGLLSKPFLLANVAHYRVPRCYSYNYNANHGPVVYRCGRPAPHGTNEGFRFALPLLARAALADREWVTAT